MTIDNPYPELFSPFELAGQTLKNRIVHASISPRFGAEHGMNPAYYQYFVNRARGGAAMVVMDPVGISPLQSGERLITWNASMQGDLERIAHGVREQGSILLGQIQDTGRGRHVPGRSYTAIGASALPDDLSYTMPRAMSVKEIQNFIEMAALSCLRMQACGFGGVEISAAHGHLFHQFLSERSNVRDDEYGGDLAGRSRLLVEMCLAIRAACGPGFILGAKIPGDDGIPRSIGLPQCHAIAKHLSQKVKLDYLTLAMGTHHRTLEMHLPDDSAPRLTWMKAIASLREFAPGVALMGLGRITDPAEAQAVLVSQQVDLIGLGRALIVDPNWPKKAKKGLARDIRYCVSCNTCWKTINSNRSIGCDNNPRLTSLNEIDDADVLTTKPKHIAVVGAGPAGLEAASTLAARGHRVTVFGKSSEVGGKARLLANLPLCESLSSVYDYLYLKCTKHDVQFILGRQVNAQEVMAHDPDEVILATGATMTWPVDLPKSLQEEGFLLDLRESIKNLLRSKGPQKGCAVIFDMDQSEGTYNAAEYLKDRFERVVILSPRETIAEQVVLVMRQRILRRFHERGIEIKTLVEPVWSDKFESESILQYRSVFAGPLKDIHEVSFFAYATPMQPNQELFSAFEAYQIPVHLIGDGKIARDLLSATAEGYAIGIKL
jgi:2,4-dienoyl-CoA reductase-like NADH-dependent reductase (Old Yellow Enzyme family)/thioredoxin reductase